MRCPDGTVLVSRIWRPERGGPWPVLLMRQPYGRAIASTVTYAHPSWYARHGFLVVVQDVRGRGDSGGLFRGFSQEAADGAASVRWARGLEGSNGRLGCYGFSYQGLSQLLIDGPGPAAGAAADPFPDCLVPACCGLDERLHWAGEGGAHWWANGLAWALQLAAEGARRRGDADGWRCLRRSLESGAYLHEGLELLAQHDAEGMGLGWLRRDPARPQGWRRHRPAPELLRRPMLLVGGWHDPQLQGVLDLWRRARAAGGRPRLVIGAWSHLDWRGGIDALQLAFFRQHLQPGAPAPSAGPGGETAVRLQCTTTGGWRQLPATGLASPLASPLAAPPAQPQPAPARLGWALASDGLAALRSDDGQLVAAGSGRGELVLVHDPWRPVPGRGGHLGPEPGLVERADLDRRSDVACFSSGPLPEGLELLGEPRLRLDVEADQPGFDLCASLSLLGRDGRVLQLVSGYGRFRGEDCRHRRPRRLRLQPLRASVAPGERLRLSLAAAAWPQLAVNPGDGSLPLAAVGPGHRVISLRLHLDTSRFWLMPLFGAN
jgi:putative CocE/NonD family hydrolase